MSEPPDWPEPSASDLTPEQEAALVDWLEILIRLMEESEHEPRQN